MFARFLGWLRLRPGPVVEQIPPAEAAVHAEQWAAREREIADIDAQIDEAYHYGEMALVDRLLDMRLGVRAPRVRPSVPVIPGRTS